MQTAWTHTTRGQPVPEALIDECRWLRGQNLSFREIAQRVGLSTATVGKYLKGEGEAFYDLTCEYCGKSLVAFRSHRRWCDSNCRRAWRWRNDEEFRARMNAQSLWRYHNDPEYRAKRLAYMREYKRAKRRAAA